MTTQGMAELDAWILVNIFHEVSVIDCAGRCRVLRPAGYFYFQPTTDTAVAMEVLKKCCIKIGSCDQLPIRWDDGQWVVGQDPATVGYIDESIICGETLELAICLFAKKLFTK